MSVYTVYQLIIKSAIAFPDECLCLDPEAEVDVHINYGAVGPQGLEFPVNHGFLFQASSNAFWMNVPNVGRFLVERGSITIDADPLADEDTIMMFLTDACIPALLMQRGLLLLQGNVVQIGLHTVLLAGVPGVGKSTLTMALSQRGHGFLADDMCVLNPKGEVLTGLPRLHLWTDVLDALDLDHQALKAIRPSLQKFSVPVKICATSTPPLLTDVYLFGISRDQQTIAIDRIDAEKHLQIIQTCLYKPQYINSRMMSWRNEQDYDHIINKLTLTTIMLPQWTDVLEVDDVIDLIEGDLLNKLVENKVELSSHILHSGFKRKPSLKKSKFQYFLEDLKAIWENNEIYPKEEKTLVWLASYPKSGNTWMRIFLANLLKKAKDPINISENFYQGLGCIASSRSWLDYMSGVNTSIFSHDELDQILPHLYKWFGEKNQKMTYIKSHDAYCADNRELCAPSACFGAVYLVRNPLDVAISYAKHSNSSIDQCIASMNHPNMMLANDNDTYNEQRRQTTLSWSLHAKSWIEAHELKKCVVRYEDMKLNPNDTFMNVVKFLKLNVTRAHVEKALLHTSFETLKKMEQDNGFKEKPLKSDAFFRKGIIGDWQNTLTKEQINRIISAHGEMMYQLGYLDEHGTPSLNAPIYNISADKNLNGTEGFNSLITSPE